MGTAVVLGRVLDVEEQSRLLTDKVICFLWKMNYQERVRG